MGAEIQIPTDHDLKQYAVIMDLKQGASFVDIMPETAAADVAATEIWHQKLRKQKEWYMSELDFRSILWQLYKYL